MSSLVTGPAMHLLDPSADEATFDLTARLVILWSSKAISGVLYRHRLRYTHSHHVSEKLHQEPEQWLEIMMDIPTQRTGMQFQQYIEPQLSQARRGYVSEQALHEIS